MRAIAARRWKGIALSVLLGTIAAAGIAWYLPARYESTFRVRFEGPGIRESDLATEAGSIEEIAGRAPATATPSGRSAVEATCEGGTPREARDLCAAILSGYLEQPVTSRPPAIVSASPGAIEDTLGAVRSRLLAAQETLASRRLGDLRAQLRSLGALSLDLEWGSVGRRSYFNLSSYPAPLRREPVPGILETLSDFESQRAMLADRGGDRGGAADLDRRIAELEARLRTIVAEYEQSVRTGIRSLEASSGGGIIPPGPPGDIPRLERKIEEMEEARRGMEARLAGAPSRVPAPPATPPVIRVVVGPTRPVASTVPGRTLLLIAGPLLGLALGSAFVVRRERAPTAPAAVTVAATAVALPAPEVPAHPLALPLLATIPLLSEPGPVLAVRPLIASGLFPRLPAAGPEQSSLERTLERVVAAFDPPGGDPAARIRSVAVASRARGEGSTFVACNLALVGAARGLRTLLLDANLQNPGVGEFFRLAPSKYGLIEVLRARSTTEETCVQFRVEKTGELSVLPAGNALWLTEDVVPRSTLSDELRKSEAAYDLVIVDAPALGSVEGAAAAEAQAVILVIRAGGALEAFDRDLERLGRTGARVLGVVRNAGTALPG
ncbi:hypothetical protein BH18GEM1_BH18GEM1_10020 [soil metagenome]